VLTIDSPSINGDQVVDAMVAIEGNGGGLTINGPTAWTMSAAMTTNSIGAGTATIGGTSTFELADTLHILGDTDITAPVVFGSGGTAAISAGAVLDVTGSTEFDGGTITGDGTYFPDNENMVQSDSAVTVAVIDFDRGNWAVQPDANLVVDVDDYETGTTKSFDSSVTLNSGSIGVMTGESRFVMDGTLNMSNTTGTEAAWGGQGIEIGNDTGALDANVNVGGTGISRFYNSVYFKSDADVSIGTGAKLVLNTVTEFETDGLDDGTCDAEFTGLGSLVFNSTVRIREALVVDMPGGVMDLDGEPTDPGGNYVYVDAPAVLNLSQFSFGQPKAVPDRLEVNHLDAGKAGLLTINLPGDTGWTLNSGTGLYLVNDNFTATLLAGSDITVNGGISVTGDVRTDARLDINGSVYIGTAGQPFRLSAGNLIDRLNTLNGGLINGPGLLGADELAGLKGYGVIDTDIDFDGLSEITAYGGLLDINGDIIDIGTLRVDGASAILDLALPFDSSHAQNGITLFNGGRIEGADITISGFLPEQDLRGNGTVQNRIINNYRIRAAGGTLTLENANNDLDGAGPSEDGLLHADSGDLVLNNSSTFIFNGTVRADSGFEVFANGFELQFQSASTLQFYGGTFRSTEPTLFLGTIEVNGGTSSIDLPASSSLWTGNAVVNGTLEFVCPDMVVNGSVNFTGTGTLRNTSGSLLTLEVGVDFPFTFENDGILNIGTGPARIYGTNLQQNAGATMRMEIKGTNFPSDFDRIDLSGTGHLAGKLEVSLAGGFTPVLGNSFPVIIADGGFPHEFDEVDFSAADPGPGLAWDVVYSSTTLKLVVVAAGTFDDWIDSFPELTNPADKTKSADPDGDGIDNWGEFALDGHPASGASSGKIVAKMAVVDSADVWTLTFPMRQGCTYDPADPSGGEVVLRQITDGLIYTIRASHDLADFSLDVGEAFGPDEAAIHAGLPALNPGWEYQTFSRPAPVAPGPPEFLHVEISEM
jgi:hypothetical protein